jgi:hypothetical protein
MVEHAVRVVLDLVRRGRREPGIDVLMRFGANEPSSTNTDDEPGPPL